ncbi:MAG: aminotransferase class V-fold PLP-dependent enzyme [Chloracidobacterium sp.]|nr:aminotransferase class V-fold PLP-dependent enzyme [Chloracidobacterium sp.]
MIYFDNNATTQIAPKVFEAMRPFLETEYWNPSSAYDRGKETAKAIETARESVAALLGSENADEIAFTSGGTESDNWAILGALEANPEKDHIITTRVEHDAVRKLCEKLEQRGKRVTWLEVGEDGSLDIDSLRTYLDERTAIVSIMLANNETGILFPVEEIAEIVRENSDALVHVDGVNAAGKIAIDLKATKIDLFSVSAHKFNGPKGVGALYIRDGVDLPSMYFGGGQENGRRAGTEAVHQIVAIGAAAELVRDMSPMRSISEMRDRLENAILATIPDAYLNGTADATKRLPNTSYISFANTNGETILAKLDEAGICVSTGSACNSQDHTPSGVLQAMNVPYARAMGAIRFSLGRNNTAAEVETVIEVLPGIIENLRKLGN